MMRNSVVLPQPDGPRNVTNSTRFDREIDLVQRRRAAIAMGDAGDLNRAGGHHTASARQRTMSLRIASANAMANSNSVTAISRVDIVLIDGSMVRRMLDQM